MFHTFGLWAFGKIPRNSTKRMIFDHSSRNLAHLISLDNHVAKPGDPFLSNDSRFRRVALCSISFCFAHVFITCQFRTNKVMILRHRISDGDVLGQPRDSLVAILGGLGAMLGRLGGFFDETIEGQFFDNSSMN